MIGERIRAFGKLNFSSIKDFAAALYMAPSNLQSYLSGKREPGAQILKRLRELGCDINWLLTGETKRQSTPNILEEKIAKLEEENQKLRANIGGALAQLKQVKILTKKTVKSGSKK